MILNQFQYYIDSIIEFSKVSSNVGQDLALKSFMFLVGADIILFIGILVMLVTFGYFYGCSSSQQLIDMQVRLFRKFLYLSLALLIISIVIISGYEWEYKLNIMNAYYCINISTQLIKLIIVIISIIFSNFIYFIDSDIVNKGTFTEFPLLFQILVSLSFIIVSSTNFALLLLTLEGFSLTLYILTTVERTHGGVTAAVKYFSFGTLGSILLFWGVVHLYFLIPTLSYQTIFSVAEYILLDVWQKNFIFSASLLVMGFLIKLGAAPLHQWVADTYTGSHMLITALFATLVKLIIFVVFIHITYFLNNSVIIDLFIISSLFIGCYFTLKQSETKRFIAYSSIVHVGFMMMGDMPGSLVYILSYIISSTIFFSILLVTRIAGKELIYLSDLRYIRQLGLGYPTMLVIALASAAGLPPFAGFYGKFSVWVSIFEDIYLYNDCISYLIATASITLSLVTIFYYARAIAYLFIGDDFQTQMSYSIQGSWGFLPLLNINNIYFMQSVGVLVLTLWTLFHKEILLFINLVSLIMIST